MEQAAYSALVVDDNPVSLLVIEKMISGYQIKVTTATGGQEALEKMTSMEYDIVFMDHLMPGMDGIETLHSIRNMAGEYYRKVPVVALTANEMTGARERFLAEGFQDFLQKPVKPATLEAVFNRFLAKGSCVWGGHELPEDEGKDTTQEWEKILIAEGFDVKTALIYCNGKASYLDILREYYRRERETERELEQVFDKNDWENYTILVHGMKSAMRSIGAMQLSEEAKLLEAAGREGRIQYILEHHREFLIQYRTLFSKLPADLLFGKSEKENRTQENRKVLPADGHDSLKDLGEEEFCKLIDDMEAAVYTLDVEHFMELVADLNQYRYKGVSLQELSESLHRKIQRADYLSAVGIVKQWKQS